MTPSNLLPPDQVDVNETDKNDESTEEICISRTDNRPTELFYLDPQGMIHPLNAGDVKESRCEIDGWIDEILCDDPEGTAREKIYETVAKVRDTRTKAELTLAASGEQYLEICMFPLPDNRILLEMQDVQDIGQPDTLDFHQLESSQIPTLVYGAGKIHHINASCMNLLGFSDLNDVLEKPFLDFVKPDNHELIRETLVHAEKNRSQAGSFRASFVRSDLSTCDAWIAVLPCKHEGNPALQVIINEVTRGDQIRIISAERDALQAQSDVYHDLMKKAEQAKETAEDQHIDLQLKIRELEKSRKTLTEEIQSLQKRLKETEDNRLTVESEKNDYIQQLKNSQTERDAARNECNSLQEQLSESEAARRVEEELKFEQLEKLKELEMGRDAARGEAMKLKGSLDAAVEAREAAEAQKREADEKCEEMQEAKALVEAEKSAFVLALREYEIERDTLREENEKLEEHIKEMDVTREELEVAKSSMEARLQQFETDLDAARDESHELQRQLEDTNNKKDDLVNALDQSDEKCTALKEELAGLNEQLNAAEEARQAAQAEVEGLLGKVKERDLATAEARGEILKLRERLHKMEGVEKTVEQQQTDLSTQLKKLEMERDAERAAKSNLQNQMHEQSESWGEKRRELEEKLRQAEEEKEAHENERIRMQDKIQEIDKAVNLRMESETECRKLEEQLEQVEAARRTVEEELCELKENKENDTCLEPEAFEVKGEQREESMVAETVEAPPLVEVNNVRKLSGPMNSAGDAPTSISTQTDEFFSSWNQEAPKESEIEKKEREAKAEERLRTAKVLFIEDEMNPHEGLVNRLEELGIPLEKSLNITNGQGAMRSRKYDLIFMAVGIYSMGDVNEMIQLRKNLGCENLPIIAVIDQPILEEKNVLVSMGLNKCIASPFNADEIRAIIDEYILREMPR